MTRRKTATWLVLAALTAGLCTGVFVNREKTRFRLAYGPGEVTVASDIASVVVDFVNQPLADAAPD